VINFIGSTQPEEAVTFYHFNFNCRLSSHSGVGVGIQGDPQVTVFNRLVRERFQDTAYTSYAGSHLGPAEGTTSTETFIPPQLRYCSLVLVSSKDGGVVSSKEKSHPSIS